MMNATVCARSNARQLLAMKCPGCGETRGRHQVARSEYDPVAPQLVGGMVFATPDTNSVSVLEMNSDELVKLAEDPVGL